MTTKKSREKKEKENKAWKNYREPGRSFPDTNPRREMEAMKNADKKKKSVTEEEELDMEENETTTLENIITGAVNQNALEVKNAVADAMLEKIRDAVEDRKAEVAQSFFNMGDEASDEETDETGPEDEEFDDDMGDVDSDEDFPEENTDENA